MAKDFNVDLLGGPPENDLAKTADGIYGGDGLSGGGAMSMRAKPLDLMSIRADVAQPRRAIPLGIRGGWDGSPDEIEHLLRLWHKRADREYSMDVQAMLTEESMTERGEDGEVVTVALPDDLSVTTMSFYKLVQFAAGIRRDGLIHPITVAKDGKGYLIESGERRYLTHHLLKMWLGEPTQIQAFVKPERNVWAQASENNVRHNLNAIGMARQVGILIMAMYEEQTETKFVPFHEMVKPGESDRAYYAQVADGREWRVFGTYSEKLVNATGLSSYDMVRKYRNLLKISDELWIEADETDMTEYAIRSLLSPPKPDRSVTTVTLRDDDRQFERVDTRTDNSGVVPTRPQTYRDDTWEDEDDEDYTDTSARDAMRDREPVVGSAAQVDELTPWLDRQQSALLYHLNEIKKLYEGTDADEGLDDLNAAIVWYLGRNDKDAPKYERELKHFERYATHMHSYFRIVLNLIGTEVDRMYKEVLAKSEAGTRK